MAGPGAKVARAEVWEVVGRMNEALDWGAPLVEVRGTPGTTVRR